MRRIERLWEELAHLDHFDFALQIGHDDRHVTAKLPNQLPTGATGGRQSIGVRHHGNGVEAALSFADGLKNGHALSTNREAVGSVLDVTATKNSA